MSNPVGTRKLDLRIEDPVGRHLDVNVSAMQPKDSAEEAAAGLSTKRAGYHARGFVDADEYRGFTVGARVRSWNDVGKKARAGTATVEAILVHTTATLGYATLIVSRDSDRGTRFAVWMPHDTVLVATPAQAASIARGLEQSAAGDTVSLGSFADHLNERKPEHAH